MSKSDKIYVAGHRGMVGSAIVRILQNQGYKNIITRTHSELDLTNQHQVQEFFAKEKPDQVYLAAAKVGGIFANDTYPADFIYQNIMIEANVIHAAYQNKVNKLLFLGSTCIYPKEIQQPMREDSLLTGVLEPTNEPYALSKIAGIKLCESYNRQHGTDFRSVMPTNLYGINDNFHPKNSHVIPALMQRFHNAKVSKFSEVVVWGTGKPMREFMYVDDMAQASLFVLELDQARYLTYTEPMLSHINVGTGIELTIKEVAEVMKEVVGFQGKVNFDSSKPDGVSRKLIDTSRLSSMGWQHSVDFREGLKRTYDWYLKEINK